MRTPKISKAGGGGGGVWEEGRFSIKMGWLAKREDSINRGLPDLFTALSTKLI